jgi:hypothetical protein
VANQGSGGVGEGPCLKSFFGNLSGLGVHSVAGCEGRLVLLRRVLVKGPLMNPGRLTPEQYARFGVWITEETEALKAKGAKEADFQEPAFANLVFAEILKKHFEEIREDREFSEAVFLMTHDDASVEDLRKWAADERRKGNLAMAYDIEVIADKQERTGVSPFLSMGRGGQRG